MRVAASVSWLSPPLEARDEAVAAWAAATLAEIGAGADALLVATSDAGARESVRFWRDSRATGLAFASPRAFPWTLANSPTGEIARRLGVRGPTFTLVGDASALTGALDHALGELASGRATRALVAALDGVDGERTRLAAVVCAPEGDGGGIAGVTRPADETLARPTPSETLAAAAAALERGRAVAVGSDRDGWIELRP